ncbi:hypothetical protein SDC9_186434 [bioreactor metagenome]|uniref:Uncharacterized protein n=1 Tax=bioreactor metagenome TaxID=1076179 RepID=A0A645HL08_9ZZZZ
MEPTEMRAAATAFAANRMKGLWIPRFFGVVEGFAGTAGSAAAGSSAGWFM